LAVSSESKAAQPFPFARVHTVLRASPITTFSEKEQKMDNYLKVPRDEPIPLSVLELDLATPTMGWSAYLAEKGINVLLDDLGRLSIHRVDAKRLFVEKREAEQKAREIAAATERAAIEKDQQFRAALPRGLPWYALPDGVSFAEAAAAAEAAEHPSRTPSPGEWLFGGADSMVYHELPQENAS
jgi:hypothetical protein